MEDNYPKAYKEIVEILKYVPEENVNKIPKEIRDMFEAKQDKDYNFKIDTEKSFDEQILLEETKAILANIFRDYWATPYQRDRILAKERYDKKKEEEEKEKKYNPNDLFKNDDKIIQENKQEQINNLPIEIKKEKFYQKLIKLIKKIFHF